jgi:hypothetical protein
MSIKRKSPEDDRASEAFHPHYYAGESRVCAYTPIIAAASSAVKPFDVESLGGPTRSCRTAQEPPAQRLRVNAERSEPMGSVYAERCRW